MKMRPLHPVIFPLCKMNHTHTLSHTHTCTYTHTHAAGPGIAEGDENCKKFLERTMGDAFSKVQRRLNTAD